MNFMNICTFSESAVKRMVVLPPHLFNIPVFVISAVGKTLDVLTVRRCRSYFPQLRLIFLECIRSCRSSRTARIRATCGDKDLFEILGKPGNVLSVVDARLLVACSVQRNIVEHAHEDDPVWTILRRGIPHRFSEDTVVSPEWTC